jgi:hypothetical protein
MTISVTYLSFDEIKQKTTDTIVFSGEKVLLEHRVAAPYAILSALDESTGEIIKNLRSRMQGAPAKPEQCWHLQCLDLYPALLCLRQIAASFRGGTKARHYHPAITFADLNGQAAYTPEELAQHLIKTYKCGPAIYPEVLALIPGHQFEGFIEAAWRTTQLSQVATSELSPEVIEHLKLYHLLPPDQLQPDLFG